MHTEPQASAAVTVELAEARGRQAFAAVTVVMATIFLVYWQTSVSMVQTWARSETFQHCFLVLPAVVWFIWQARTRLAATSVQPWWPALIPLAGAGALWLIGELASSLAPTQWAMVLMVPAAVVALFGLGWGRILSFPLAFLFFAVPFGEAMTPTLIDWTADFTVAALTATGIPVFREGQHFVIPSGRWSVVEACSGVRYLMASVMVGVLYAWTIYRSPVRRALFIGASFLVPIVANWLRAYLIVMIGHLSDNQLAVGIDHFIYGWLFFGIVIGLMLWIGTRWREDQKDDPSHAEAPSSRRAAGFDAPLRLSASMLAAVALLVGIWPMASMSLQGSTDERPLLPVAIATSEGWAEVSRPVSPWTPTLEGQARTQVLTFARDGATVTVFIGFYRDQQQGRELVSSMNRLLPESTSALQIARGRGAVRFGTEEASVRTATIRYEGQRLRIWHWYWLDDRIETSEVRAKLSLAMDRLLVRSDTSAWVAVFTDAETDDKGDAVLSAFARDMGPALNSALAATAEK